MSKPNREPQSDVPRGLPDEARQWLSEHPEENGAELEEVWRLAQNADSAGATLRRDGDRSAAMRAKLLAQIAALPEARVPSRLRLLRSGPAWAVAASILVAAAIGTILLSPPVTITAPAGQHQEIALSDGSEVLLNSGSTLKYSRVFGWLGRSVEIDGEAFFDVASASDPFQVNTFNGTVTVVGTHFNVRAWPAETLAETQVILTEGTVTLSARNTPDYSVILQAGEMSRVAGATGRPSEPVPVDADRLLVWRTGGLAFLDTTIDVLLADIQRRFDVEIVSTSEVRERRLSLFMTDVPDAEAVLDVLAGMHGLVWSKQGDGYELSLITAESVDR